VISTSQTESYTRLSATAGNSDACSH